MTLYVAWNTFDLRFEKADDKMGILGGLIGYLRNAVLCEQVVAVSKPFYADGRWQILSGDAHDYLFKSFHAFADAQEQFRSMVGLVSFGDFWYDFVLIEENAARLIRDRESYQRAIGPDSVLNRQ